MLIEKELVIYDLKQQTPGMFPDPKRPPFTVQDMENVVAQFDYDVLKPPCHHGHPKGDATDLALGSVRAVRFDGQKLHGKLNVQESVVDDFHEERLLGLSTEFYRVFKGVKGVVLRGIGFLGATPPRQKGLHVSHFSEDEKGDYDIIIVFSDNQETGELPMPEQTALPNVEPSVPGKVYTLAEIKAMTDKAASDAVAKLEQTDEFAETQEANAKLEKENEKLKSDLEAQKAKDSKADIEKFADSLEYLTAGQRPDVIALVTQLESTEDSDVEVFAEDGTSVQVSARELVGRITKPVGDSIKDTLRKTKAGAEKPTGAAAGEMTVENFAEHDATGENLQKAGKLWLKDNEGKKLSEAYQAFSADEKTSDWFHKASTQKQD